MKAVRFALVAGFAMFASVSYAAPRIDHTPLDCIAANMNAKVTAAVPGNSKVYFSLLGNNEAYYVNMRGENGSKWAVLPQLAPGSAGLHYHIVSNANGQEYSTPDVKVVAAADCQAPRPDEVVAKAASEITLGMTSEAPSEVPEGFNCNGIVSLITSADVLRPHEQCRKLMAANGGGGATMGPKPWGMTPVEKRIALGGLIVVAGGVSVVNSNNDNPAPTSNSRP